MRKPLAIIGMSPGNSYFKDYEVRFLLQESVNRFGRCAVMVADVPAISTYIALGYAPAKARNKAIPKGNSLKNRTRRIAEELGYSADQVLIIDWAEKVEPDPDYRKHYEAVRKQYDSLPVFADAVRNTSRSVLEGSGKIDVLSSEEIGSATHYLLSELAFLEFAPEFFEEDRVCYLYHKNWGVYEDYIRGHFDGVIRDHLDFLLLEAPYETFVNMNDDQVSDGNVLHDTYSRVMQSGVLRAAFVEYPPVMEKRDGAFSGIFYDVIQGFAQKHNLEIKWVEETGYGVVIDGLAEGRFDIFCSATWPTPERHRKAALSYPLYYSDVGVWVRSDSSFVGQDWINLNDGSCRIAITENDITHAICLTDFIRAKWVRVPQMARVKGLLDFVAGGQADATMVEKITYDAYRDHLAQGLSNIAREKPIRRYSNSFLVGKNQNDFLDLVDSYILELIESGQMKPIVERHVRDLEGLYFPEHRNAAN